MKRSVSLASPLHKTILVLLTLIPLLLTPVSQAANRDDVQFSQAELDQMLAPIALYPDALLSQVLIASTYPLEVIQADRWVRSNKDLKTEDALKFAQNKDWDPSVKALVAFPDVLKRMSEDVDWTQRLGDAFLSDEESVMDAVQRLRKRAYATGNLEKAQHISVERDDDYIVIEPAQERIVYVPVYDTRVVYGNWWWPDYPPVYWHYPSSYTYVSGFYWGSSIYLGSNYFYSSCRWRDRRVVVIDHYNYGGTTRFYTGREIVRHADARDWRHDPAHRHGVAYYNNNLRETYGSHHQSRENDRDYRRQFNQGGYPNPRGNDGWKRDHDNRGDNNWNNGSNNGHIDRAEQVRERLDRENSLRERRPWSGERSESGNTINTSGIRVQNQNPQPRVDNSPSLQNTEEAGRNPRFNQEQRVVTDDADRRPNFSRLEQRPQEAPRPNFGEQNQRVERQEQPRVEMPAPRNEAEGRAQFERRSENLQNRTRFSREKNDDNTK
ncbi:DUF3300 domain-containing protein [Cellvibrio sp.]|uniref:DUF3300 domain-containing protein n=1 Tax=Cellvibrio sp. TaxID=1965322 RepID=UPI003964845B